MDLSGHPSLWQPGRRMGAATTALVGRQLLALEGWMVPKVLARRGRTVVRTGIVALAVVAVSLPLLGRIAPTPASASASASASDAVNLPAVGVQFHATWGDYD